MSDTSAVYGYVFNTFCVLGAGVAVLMALLYYNQDSILYIPYPGGMPRTPAENPRGSRSPKEYAEKYKIDFEEHSIETADGEKLHAWLMMQREDSNRKPTLIYFHGNAANMGFRLPNAVEMFRHSMNVLMVDYRGYGSSTGTPSERGLNMDADAIIDFLRSRPRLDPTKIVPFGRSLGGAVAIAVAKRRPNEVAAVIVENTFTSVGAMVDHLMPFLTPLKSLVLRLKWDSLNDIRQIRQPILFIAGTNDELVPPAHMHELFAAAALSRGKEFYAVKGGRHNDTWMRAGSEYYQRMARFLVNNLTQGEVAEEDYCHVSQEDIDEATRQPPIAAIPTMQTDFSVKRDST